MEKNEPVVGQIQQMKEEVVEEVKQGKKKRSIFLSCFILLFVVFVGATVLGLWAFAASGLVEIPFISKFAYDVPEPTRLVMPGVPVETVAQSTFDTVLKERLIVGGGEIKNRFVSLSLSESSLTATLRNLLQASEGTFLNARQSQVVIRDDRDVLELFVPVEFNKRDTAVIAEIAVSLNEGVINLQLESIRIGSWRAPRFLIASLLQPIVNQQLSSLNQSIGSYIRVEKIVYQDGAVTIDGKFTVEVKSAKDAMPAGRQGSASSGK